MNSEALIAAAVAAYRRGDLRQARQLAEEQLAKFGEVPRLYHLMGMIEASAGRLDTALEWLKRASEAAPADVGIRIAYARLLADMGWVNEALAEMEEGSRVALERVLADNGQDAGIISPANLENLRELGLLLERSNQVDGLRRLLAATEKGELRRRPLVRCGPRWRFEKAGPRKRSASCCWIAHISMTPIGTG